MGILDNVAAAAEKRNAADGEYTIEDGVAVCKRCGKTRGKEVSFGDFTKFVWMSCDCLQTGGAKVNPERIAGMQQRGGVSPECTFDKAEITPIMQKCMKYADAWDEVYKRGAGLILWGAVGTGKTFAAHCIANNLIYKDVPVFITSLSKVLNSGLDKTDVLRRIRETPFVVFDDLGAERASEYALEQVFLLVDERYKTKKPLVITTNLQIDEIRNPKDIGRKRIYDRIMERCVPLLFEGNSRRAEEAAETLKFLKSLFDE